MSCITTLTKFASFRSKFCKRSGLYCMAFIFYTPLELDTLRVSGMRQAEDKGEGMG